MTSVDTDFGGDSLYTAGTTPEQRDAARQVLAEVAIRRHPDNPRQAARAWVEVLEALGLTETPDRGPRLCGCGCGMELPPVAAMRGRSWRSSCRQRAAREREASRG